MLGDLMMGVLVLGRRKSGSNGCGSLLGRKYEGGWKSGLGVIGQGYGDFDFSPDVEQVIESIEDAEGYLCPSSADNLNCHVLSAESGTITSVPSSRFLPHKSSRKSHQDSKKTVKKIMLPIDAITINPIPITFHSFSS